MTTTKLSDEIIEMLRDPDTIKVLTTVDMKGVPHTVFKESLTALNSERIAYAEILETSQTNKNMVWNIWFKRDVTVTIANRKGLSYQIKGKPERILFQGPVYKEFLEIARSKLGPDCDISGVWIIVVENVMDESLHARRKDEEEIRPFYRHLDRML